MELMDAVDTYFPVPQRDVDKPFLMPIEDVFSITGRGTVGTGRVERGKAKVGDEVELIGLGAHKKTVITGAEMFRKELDEVTAGDNAGLLCVASTRMSSSAAWSSRSRDRSRRTRSSPPRSTF